MRSLKAKGYTWLALDWSSFDTSIPAWLVRDAFAIIRQQLDFSSYEFWGKPTDDDTLERLWMEIIRYFINTPLKFQSGEVKRKISGVPSGSYFTNLIDSVINTILIHYLLDGITYQNDAFWVMGDDGLVAVKGCPKVEELASTAKCHFGMMLNVEKTEISEFPSFLGFKFHSSGVPQSNYDRLMAQLCLPTRPDRDLEEFCTRIRALQLASFGNMQFVLATQPYLDSVGISDPDFSRLSKFSEVRTMFRNLGLPWMPLQYIFLT